MAKALSCRDVGMNCDFQTRAETEEEVTRLAVEHARRDHGVPEVTPELAARVRAAIRDV